MRVRHVLTAIGALSLLFAVAVVANDDRPRQSGERTTPGVERTAPVMQPWAWQVTADSLREDIISRASNPLQKGASLVAAADSLSAQGKRDEAVDLLNRVVTMELPEGREADKLVTAAYLALGAAYNDPAMSPVKALGFYSRAIEHMDVNEDNLSMVQALGSVVAIQTALGDTAGAAASEVLMQDAQLGIRPVELGFSPGNPGASTLDAGDDTCSVPVPISIPHTEVMSIKPALDQNWRVFSLNEPRVLVIETLDADTTKDTRLDLWQACIAGNPTGLIATDDDSGPGLLSRIQTTCIPGGQYFVKVYAYSTTTPENFTFSITDQPCPTPVGADEFEIDDDPAQANKIGFRNNGNGEGNQNGRDNSQVQRHTIFPAGDFDWLKFGLSRANWVNIETFGVNGENPDTIMGAMNSGGALFAVNDDKAAGVFTSKMEFCLPSGDYYAAVLPYYADEEFSYDVAVDVQGSCLMEREPNGTCEYANDLPPGELWNGMHNSFGLTFEDDWWRITVTERSLVTIATDGYDEFNVDTYLLLYNGCPGTLIAADDDGGPGFLSQIQAILDPGTYYVDARLSPLGSPGATYPYSITVEFSEPPATETEPNNNCGQANPVELGDSLQAAIGVAGDKDFYLLNVPTGTLVDILTSGPTGDTVLDISSMSGEPQVGCDDDNGDGLFSRWNCCLPAGTYCVGVKDYGNNNTIPNYTIGFNAVGTCNPSEPLVCPIASSSQCPHPF